MSGMGKERSRRGGRNCRGEVQNRFFWYNKKVEKQDWLPLDNAAKIYPSTASVKSPAEFRLGVTFLRPVRLLHLQRALERVMPRFPYFQVNLRRGFFWYYLQRSRDIPRVELLENVPATLISIKERTAPLLRVSARSNRIAVDFSHILTDGSGGLRFLLSLAAEYIRQGGGSVEPGPLVMDPDEAPQPEEFEDSHRKNYGGKTPPPHKVLPSFHLPGRPFLSHRFRTISGESPVQNLLDLSRTAGVTLTEYLAGVLVYSLGQIYLIERKRRLPKPSRRSIIRLEIPVDMRRHYPSGTMRNFSLFLSPEIDFGLGDYSFEEVLHIIHHSVRLQKNTKQLGRQISRNVGSELNPFVRFMPLFVKDMILSSVYTRLGESLHSGVISNLGNVELPPGLDERVNSLQFAISPNYGMKKSCSVLSLRDQLSIVFTRVIEDRTLEKLFFTHLTERGVPVKVKEE